MDWENLFIYFLKKISLKQQGMGKIDEITNSVLNAYE